MRLSLTRNKRIASLISWTPDSSKKAALYLDIYMGLRRSELCALHWSDVNFKDKALRVRASLYKWQRDLTKNESSNRYMNLPEDALALPLEHKAWQEQYAAALGDAWRERSIVFANTRGGYLQGQDINKYLKTMIEGKWFPEGLRLHSLRHSCSSLQIHRRASAQEVTDYLDHANANITNAVYIHVFNSAHARPPKMMNDILKRPGKGEQAGNTPLEA
jgi:integrase